MSIRYTNDPDNSNEYLPQSLISPLEDLRQYLWRSLLENKVVASNEEFQGALVLANHKMTDLMERMDVSPLSDLTLSLYASQLVIQLTLIYLVKDVDVSETTGVFFTRQRTQGEITDIEPLLQVCNNVLSETKEFREQAVEASNKCNAHIDMIRSLILGLPLSSRTDAEALNRLHADLEVISRQLRTLATIDVLLGNQRASKEDQQTIKGALRAIREDLRALREDLSRQDEKVNSVSKLLGRFGTQEEDPLTVCNTLNRIINLTGTLPQETASRVGDEVVGESYYRWDSRVRYFPTLVLPNT